MTLREGRYMLPDGSVVELLISTVGGNWRLQRLDGMPLNDSVHGIITSIDRTHDTVHLVVCDLRVEDVRPVEKTAS